MKKLITLMVMLLGLASCCDRCKAEETQHPLIQELNEIYELDNWNERRKATLGLIVRNPELADEAIENFNVWSKAVWFQYRGAKDERELLCHVKYGDEYITIPTKSYSAKNPSHQNVYLRNLRPICLTLRPPEFPPRPKDPPPCTKVNAGE